MNTDNDGEHAHRYPAILLVPDLRTAMRWMSINPPRRVKVITYDRMEKLDGVVQGIGHGTNDLILVNFDDMPQALQAGVLGQLMGYHFKRSMEVDV